MDFYVFDQDYALLGILASPISVTYTEKYNDRGDFQVNLPVDEINRELIKSDNVILFDKEKGIAGIIGIISTDGETDDSPQIVAKGKLIEEYIYRRIVWGLFSITETPEKIVHSMLMTQVISPTDPNRAIADIVLKASALAEVQKISYQNTGGNVGDNIASICASSGIGFRLSYHPSDKQMLFELYEGNDRTIEQRVLPQALFSTEYENIMSTSYNLNTQDMKNVALVAGEDSGTDRKTTSVGVASGKSRREYFVDARDIQSTNSDGMTISAEDYIALLKQRGTEKLADVRESQSFDCTVNTVGNIQYDQDYFLGDMVTVYDSLLNLQLNARISEVQHAFTSFGEELYITFGFGPMTLTKKLRLKGV